MFDARDFGGELLAEKSVEEREVTVTARIRNEHCPFQACVTYQVDSITGTWGNTTESYRSTDPVYSTVAGETYDFMAKIPATKLTGRKVRFMIEVTTQHRLYVSSDFEEYVVPGPIEPDPDQPGDSGESDGSEK